MNLLTRLLLALLNGVITFVILLIIAVILNRVGLQDIGSIVSQFAWIIAVLVGALTFFGVLPNYWNGLVK